MAAFAVVALLFSAACGGGEGDEGSSDASSVSEGGSVAGTGTPDSRSSTEEPGSGASSSTSSEDPGNGGSSSTSSEGPGNGGSSSTSSEDPGHGGSSSTSSEDPGNEGSSSTSSEEPPEAPVVTASRNQVGAVELTWPATEGAVAWNVYVGETRLNTEPLDTPGFSHNEAPPAPPVSAPGDLRATDAVEEEVQLSWGGVEPTMGATVTYVVEALAEGGASALSDPVDGWRTSGPVEGWEVRFEDQVINLGAEADSWADDTLPAGAPPEPQPTLHDLGPLGVDLEATFEDSPAPTRDYRVVARTAQGLGEVAGPVTGSRPVGEWELRWYSGESEEVINSSSRRVLVGTGTPLRDRNSLGEDETRFYVPVTRTLDELSSTSGVINSLVGRAALVSACAEGSDCASGHCAEQKVCAPMPLADTTEPIPMAFVPAGSVILHPGDSGTGVYVAGEVQAAANITRGYFVTETLLTRGQFRALFPDVPFPPNLETCIESDCPMGLYGIEIAGFANALSAREGLTQCYSGFSPAGCDPIDQSESSCLVNNVVLAEDCDGYRLGSGVEWMRAAWGDGDQLEPCAPYTSCLNDIVWWADNSEDRGHPVGRMPVRLWGIYDILGNYSERVHHLGAGNAEAVPFPIPDDFLQTRRMIESMAALGGNATSSAAAFRRSAGLGYSGNPVYTSIRDTRAGVRLFRTAPEN